MPNEPLPRSAIAVQRVLHHIDQHIGISPHRYICQLRVQRAQALMRNGIPPATAASEAGFYDQSHLSRHFKSMCGMTPGQYLARQSQPSC
jgi:AraC-like DNA-binding protein